MSGNINGQQGSRSWTLNLEANTVTVKVATGEDARSFAVHRDIICTHSPFFNSAFNGDWKESNSKFLELPDDSTEAFDLYLQWLYQRKPLSHDIVSELSTLTCLVNSNGKVKVESLTSEESTKGAKIEVKKAQKLLVDACILGDKLRDLDFADAAMDALLDCAENGSWYPTFQSAHVYEKTLESSPLKRLFTDLYVFVFDSGWSPLYLEDLSKDALYEITKLHLKAKKAHELNEQIKPWKTNPCLYHHHVKTNQPCYKTKLDKK